MIPHYHFILAREEGRPCLVSSHACTRSMHCIFMLAAIYASKQSVKLKYRRKQKQNLSHLVCWLHNIPCSSNGLMSSTNLEWIFSIQVHLSALYYKLITLLQVNVYCLLSHFVQSRDVVKRSNFSAKCVHSWPCGLHTCELKNDEWLELDHTLCLWTVTCYMHQIHLWAQYSKYIHRTIYNCSTSA